MSPPSSINPIEPFYINRIIQKIGGPFGVFTTLAALKLLLAGCATAPLDEAGTLQSYAGLQQSDGFFTRSRISVSRNDVLAAKTIKIIPTVFSAPAQRTPFTAAQRNLVTNAVDRALCAGLSERLQVVGPSEPADLVVQAVVTNVAATDPIAVGVSKSASIVKSVLLPGVPVPVPRLPLGLGSLSLEAEARDPQGRQKAAMIWGRGANALLGQGRVASEADAYSLAASFGGDFSTLLVTGKTPFGGGLPSLPSMERIGFLLGGTPKYPACETFGRSDGVVGFLGAAVGVPPNWTDNGAAAPR